MEILIKFFLIHWAFMIVLYKYDIKGKILAYSQKTRRKFFYELSQCEFCIEHHVGVILAVLWIILGNWSLELLIYPLMSSALINIVKTIRK